MNYYNEFDPFAAEWLKALIQKGLIPDGEIDTRSIVDVRPDDLKHFSQCHFFAGIGGWSHALRLAGWPDDRPIWTGSCPCQPFSVAGKGKGKEDERHLWPVFFDLIRSVRPPVVMGEQVAGKAGYGWFDGVQSDLEGEDYASRAVDIPACAVNAPHIRQRLYWVACNMENSISNGCEQQRSSKVTSLQGECPQRGGEFSTSGLNGELSGRVEGFRGPFVWERPDYAINDKWWERENSLQQSALVNTDGSGQRKHGWPVSVQSQQPGAERAGSDAFDMADTQRDGRQGQRTVGEPVHSAQGSHGETNQPVNVGTGFWRDFEWLTGADGKTRRAKPGVRLLAHGLPNRVGRLRGYGNAIVPPLAAKVIKAFLDTEG